MNNLLLRSLISGTLKFWILLIGINILVMCTPGDSDSRFRLKLYVSKNGNDSWSGKLIDPNLDKTDGPLSTLEGARDAIRTMKDAGKLRRGNVIVEIQGGVYELTKAFELDSLDGGNDPHSRIIYLGRKGSEVRLVGGKNLSGWELVKEKDILEQFNPEVRGKIYQTDLGALGVSDFGSPGGGGAELFFNDQPMWISRYPNKSFVKITEIFNENPVNVRGTIGDRVGKFKYDDKRIAQWTNEKDAWVHGYWFWDWNEQRHKIAKIDPLKKIIEIVPPYHLYGYRVGQWFYGFNLLSEIDEPGEYYIDREKGLLFFYPPSDIASGQTYISLIKTMVNMKKVSFLTIQGVIFEGCRETVIKEQDCQNNLILGCTIRNSGDWAVSINGGIKNGVAGCDIYNVGAGGIMIRSGDRKTLVPGECFADNNYIHHTARIKRLLNPCVSLNGVGNRATHNLIEHVPHMAIFFNGNDHLMEYNDIHDVCYESNDAGAIYAGRNWTFRGNIIRYNYLHDISGFEGKGCVGVYLDDAFSSADIIGNVFKKVSRSIQIGGGRDNNVINNIFIDCIPSIHVDARGIGWMENSHIPDWIKEANEKGTILGIAYNKPPYSIRYPKLINILEDEPKKPKGNVISKNICVGGNWDKPSGLWKVSIEKKARPYLKMEDNVVAPGAGVEDSLSKSFEIVDPMFINQEDPEQGKFQLDAKSPALERGFIQISFDKIGLYESNERASWPISKN